MNERRNPESEQRQRCAAADRKTNWLGVSFGVGLGVLAAYHMFKLPPVLPLMLERYSYDRLTAGGFMSIYAAAGLLASALIGVMLQRRGLRPFLPAAAGLFIAGSLIAIAVPEQGPLVLLGRGLEGLAFAVFAVAGPMIAIGSANARHIPIATALCAAWIPLGQIIALGLAHPIVTAALWRPLWWIGIGATVVFATAAWRWTRTPRATLGNDVPARQRFRAVSPMRRWALLLAAGIFTLWSTQIFAMFTWLPQYLVEERGLDAAGAILPYGIPALLILIFNLVGGVMLRAGLPLAPLMALGLALQALIWFLLPLLGGTAAGVAALVAFGIGAGVTPTCLFAAPGAILGQGRSAGTAFGIIMTGRSLGVLIGPILLPPALIALGAWANIGPLFGGIALVAMLGALALGALMARLNRAAIV